MADLRLSQSQFGNELKIQSDYEEVQLGGGRVPQLNKKTETILDTIEAMAVGETSHHLHDDVLDITKNGLEVNQKALDILDQIRDQEPDEEGRKCVKKIMMREETEYDEVQTCHHSYDKRCHDSYITTYEPHSESGALSSVEILYSDWLNLTVLCHNNIPHHSRAFWAYLCVIMA